MKKQILFFLALTISAFTFAQKAELKNAEKAIKNDNFNSAKTILTSLKSMVPTMDDKYLAKYYYLNAVANYAKGTANQQEIDIVLESIKKLRATEMASGKKVYSDKIGEVEKEMTNDFVTKAQNALKSKDYETSYINFERVYRASPQDTSFLYNAAVLATQNKSYDKALELYDELKKLGYTGITNEYYAVNVVNDENELFPNKDLRDVSVRTKSHKNPTDVTTDSKVGDMAKNVAIIYIDRGEDDKAIEAIEEAKKSNPDNFDLLVAESNVRYKLGQMDKYKELVTKAIELHPDNVDLVFNLGVVAAEAKDYDEAKKFYEKALEIDPEYVNAHLNLGALILAQEEDVIEEMNQLGTSAADDKKYEELKAKRRQLYIEAIPHLNNVLSINPSNIGAAKTLMNIYSALDNTEKFNEMKEKVEVLETGGN